LEEEIRKGVKPIYPVRSVAIRKSQLLQDGVVTTSGPTLDEIHAQEARDDAEFKAKKAAALAAAMADEGDEESGEEAESDEVVEDAPKEAAPVAAPEEAVEEATVVEEKAEADAPAYDKMTVAELKELLKAAGKPVSGKKADLITRLSE